ncbi:unnamed protein product [Clonostachys byssicola]|uniref:Amine oxidase domain-containing protein n=1 Tax=Clonostachys byssicola TaxID=160290 RepID=A0A9N9YA92_9HYPO|nr:unnamed protein product [Clonostachys byssicola]
MRFQHTIEAGLLVLCGVEAAAIPKQPRDDTKICRKTKVAVLGAGVAGITAAQALTNASVTDFIIVERNNYIGGRVVNTTFGQKSDGTPYAVELGANWVHGIQEGDGPKNPIWTLAQKYNLDNTPTDSKSVITYDETGQVDYKNLIDEYEEAWEGAQVESGRYLTENLQDITVRAGLSLAGWRPHKKDMHAQAVDWFGWDFESATPPEDASLVFGMTGVYNATYNHFSEEDRFVWDQRGFNTMVNGEARTFLQDQDSRLLLNTIVKSIKYTDTSVEVLFENGDCIEAEYAICTFSVGVLQNDVVKFEPELPLWKQEAIESFTMGTYTKIFMQFNETFWDSEKQYLLYADPHERGRYTGFQSLTGPGFHEGSNLIFVTVTNAQSWVVEQQTDEETKAEVLAVLRSMFPGVNIPEPTAFMYPRWSQNEFSFGSFSNWPLGTTLERHQNLRANVDRLWFAGEATSTQHFGFLHGAWFEGQEAGERVSSLLKGNLFGSKSGPMEVYKNLHGTTEEDQYNESNGWYIDTVGDE